MRKLTTRLIVALLTFVVGVAATTLWFVNRQPTTPMQSTIPRVRTIRPKAKWEPIYFRVINSVAKLSGQAALRQAVLAEGDFEIRVWWGFGLVPLEGITLRRVAGQWSAIHVKADDYSEPRKAERKELRPPKDGWQAFWHRLVNAGILTLPDASEVNCNVFGLDGDSYVVEINKDDTYRTYMYDMPYEAKCDEAKTIMEIGDIIFEEVYSQR